MKHPQTVKSGAGALLKLGSIIGRGGEGTVYNIEGKPEFAAKLYAPDKAADRHKKIAAMVALGFNKKSTIASFPVELLFDPSGTFLGFTMRKVAGHRPIHEVYGPADRKIEFPSADFRFLVRSAANTARSVLDVNKLNCVIGDVNHSGILVSDRATVALIDADSFQVSLPQQKFLCKVGVPDFTPPELQGAPLSSTLRTANHDAFGLAICVFQLLFMGRHPFAGRFQHGDMPIPKAIGEYRFAYSTQHATGMRPPPNVPTLHHFPLMIASYFENAFGRVGTVGLRPTAIQWIGALVQLERDLKQCASNARHWAYKSAPECPWCKMEEATGIVLFLPLSGAIVAPAKGKPTDLEGVWIKINAVPSPGKAPDLPVMLASVLPSQNGVRSASSVKEWAAKSVSVLMALVALVILQSTLLGALVSGAIAWGLFSYQDPAYRAARRRLKEAEARWSKMSGDWVHRAGDGRFLAAKAELQEQYNSLREVNQQEARRLRELETNKRAAQLEAFLDQHHISRASIPGIGSSRTSTLASYGIETAWDVTYRRVMSVPGFGQKTTADLLAWRSTIERRFVFNPQAKTDPRLIASIRAEFAQKRSPIETQLKKGPATLESIRQSAIAARKSVPTEIRSAYQELLDAKITLGRS